VPLSHPSSIHRRPSGTPAVFRLLLALALPAMAGLTVIGTFLGGEVVVAALWVSLVLGGFLFIQPVIGIAAMTAVYLLTAYPTILQSLGFLTVNNLLGLCFAVLLAQRILESRDFSWMRVPQFQLLALIGVILVLGTFYADVQFPLLQVSTTTLAKAKTLDRTDAMTHDFVTRLVFLVFMAMFVRSRRDVGIVFVTFMVSLYAAIPSAILNWMQGNLSRGFRAMSSVTVGANPNKLAMICLMEVTCWWFWAHSRPGLIRRAIGLAAVLTSLFVLVTTGSRSGILGAGVLGVLLQTGPKQFRVSKAQIALGGAAGVLAIALFVPADTWQRMINFAPDKGEIGATSNEKREETIMTGLIIFRDYPLLGVGLGNFREVSRQVYGDPYYRPPHNSPLWAGSEGGIFVLGLYTLLFWITWRDMQRIMALGARDLEIAHIAAGLRVVFLLFCFFSLFADLWLNTITYLLVGQIVAIRRYLETLPAVASSPIAPARYRHVPVAA
jgi:O-antigen ligase/polysaccharide polymerase Wzy-like membrane protein